jgi:hypothetical protein
MKEEEEEEDEEICVFRCLFLAVSSSTSYSCESCLAFGATLVHAPLGRRGLQRRRRAPPGRRGTGAAAGAGRQRAPSSSRPARGRGRGLRRRRSSRHAISRWPPASS